MKIHYEDIPAKQGNRAFLSYAYTAPAFAFRWHYHPEYELTLILRGSGKRLVGDSHENFVAGDLVLLGPELPHTWVSEQAAAATVSAAVTQFTPAFIGAFLHFPECAGIRSLLQQSKRGVFFPLTLEDPLLQDLYQLTEMEGVVRIGQLLQVLDQLSRRPGTPLASAYYQLQKSAGTEKRINTVCQYVQQNLGAPISVQQAAAGIHLSVGAFCKFFKRTTGQTFSDYVNDLRIGQACQLLLDSEKSIAEIALQTGFENLSYFNRVFLRKKGKSPSVWRKAVGGEG